MNFRNTTSNWGAVSKALHWIIVLLIINQWVIAERADALPAGLAKLQALAWHKSFGITIFLLAVLRLAWRWMNPVPSLEGLAKPWERALARLSHVLLYALIFAMPISGWLMSSAKAYSVSWFRLVQLPDLIGKSEPMFKFLHVTHKMLFSALVAVAVLHALGALKHHFIDRNNVLKRMLPFGGVK